MYLYHGARKSHYMRLLSGLNIRTHILLFSSRQSLPGTVRITYQCVTMVKITPGGITTDFSLLSRSRFKNDQ